MVGRPARIVGRTIDRGEGGPAEAPEPARVRLALVEEAMTEAEAAVRFQQHRLAAVEDLLDREAARDERTLERLVFVGQRDAGGCTNHAPTVESEHEQAVRRTGVGRQVLRLIGRVAVIQIGIVAKHRDAQPRHGIEVFADLGAAESGDANGRLAHRLTWSIQSCRL